MAERDMTDDELITVILKVYPMVAKVHLKIARAAIEADRARRIVQAEPWLKADEVRERGRKPTSQKQQDRERPEFVQRLRQKMRKHHGHGGECGERAHVSEQAA